MARKKGPKMISELILKRANGLGFSTIAQDLKIARNTVKTRLKEVGAYEVEDAQKHILSVQRLILPGMSPKWWVVAYFF